MLFIALIIASLAIAVVAFVPAGGSTKARTTMKIELPPLPYGYDALEPHIGQQTLEIHHDKHHAKYVKTANTMVEGTEMEGMSEIEILRKAYGNNQGLFNNAAQSFNHAFYWNCMKPAGGGKPTGKLMEAIEKDFGSYGKSRSILRV